MLGWDEKNDYLCFIKKKNMKNDFVSFYDKMPELFTSLLVKKGDEIFEAKRRPDGLFLTDGTRIDGCYYSWKYKYGVLQTLPKNDWADFSELEEMTGWKIFIEESDYKNITFFYEDFKYSFNNFTKEVKLLTEVFPFFDWDLSKNFGVYAKVEETGEIIYSSPEKVEVELKKLYPNLIETRGYSEAIEYLNEEETKKLILAVFA